MDCQRQSASETYERGEYLSVSFSENEDPSSQNISESDNRIFDYINRIKFANNHISTNLFIVVVLHEWIFYICFVYPWKDDPFRLLFRKSWNNAETEKVADVF